MLKEKWWKQRKGGGKCKVMILITKCICALQNLKPFVLNSEIEFDIIFVATYFHIDLQLHKVFLIRNDAENLYCNAFIFEGAKFKL